MPNSSSSEPPERTSPLSVNASYQAAAAASSKTESQPSQKPTATAKNTAPAVITTTKNSPPPALSRRHPRPRHQLFKRGPLLSPRNTQVPAPSSRAFKAVPSGEFQVIDPKQVAKERKRIDAVTVEFESRKTLQPFLDGRVLEMTRRRLAERVEDVERERGGGIEARAEGRREGG